MKAIASFVVAMVLLCSLANASVMYTIPLPAGPSQSEFFTAGAGNNYWTVGTGGQLFGVNLTAKKLQSTKDLRGSSIMGLVGLPNGGIVVQLPGTLSMAFDSMGNFLWTSNEFTFSTRANAYTIIGNTAYIASESMQQFFTVDLTSGLVTGTPMTITAGNVYSNFTVLTTPGPMGTVLTSYSLPDMQVQWSVNNVVHYLTANSDYLLVTNISASQETQVLVVSRSTMAVVSTLHAMEGVYTDGFTPVITGRFGLFLVGVEVVRLAYIDLLSGVIHYEIYIGSTNGGSFIGGVAYATISNTMLTVIDLKTGKQTLSVNNVPYSPAQTITYLGDDVISVANLQGYTNWNVKTGALVARDEMQPGLTAQKPYSWNGYSVYTNGASVVITN